MGDPHTDARTPEPPSVPVTHSLVKTLRNVPDLAALDDRKLLRIVGASVNLFWPAGASVFEKGDHAEALYVVLTGQVRIFDVADGRETDVSRLGPGESFGELSLLLGTRHTKNAQAVEDTELMVVPEETFRELLTHAPDLDAHFRRRLEERRPVRGDGPDTA
jgi:CRP/FNR family transcriptional regulator, cyclic AMP receptor protein